MNCTITRDGNIITGNIISQKDVKLYAFYVLNNDTVVHKQNYSTDNTIIYDTHGEPGLYYLSCFTIDSNDNRSMAKTSFQFIHGPLLDLDELSNKQLSSRSLIPFHVRSGYQNFHCLFSRGDTDRLFVLLTAAISRKTGITNQFNRINTRHQFKGHCLYISDPTLSTFPELDLGWYLGDRDHYATKDMALLVSFVAGYLGIANDKIISYGSSGGGFAAMALANQLPGACAVANNPQANALNYIPSTVNSVLANCFHGMTRQEVENRYRERIDMTYSLRNTKSRMLLVQNTLDRMHWEPHYLPLAETLTLPASSGPSVDGQHHAIIYSDERGHAAAPPAVFFEIMDVLETRFMV